MSAIETYLAKPWLAHYQQGVPATVEVPLKSVCRPFDEATERAPDRPAVAFYGRSLSYRELREATDRLAGALADLGVKKGERVALYLLNSPQFIIAYFAALKCGATVTPISPVYTSHEVRYQLEDSGARAIVCQDILYEKVAKSGAALDLVIVTNVNEYLPALKRLFSKKAEIPGGAHWLQDLLKKYPAKPPGGEHRTQSRSGGAALHRRHDRQPEGRDAHALQPGRRPDDGTGGVLRVRAGQGSDPRLSAVFSHLRPGRDHAERLVPGEPARPFHQPRHRGDPGGDGALSRDRVLRRADALRVPEGPQGHQQDRLEAPEARALGRRHAARVDDAGLGEAHRLEHHRGLRPVGNLRHQPRQPAAPAEDRLVRLPDPGHAGRGDRPRHARVRAAGGDRRARAVRAERDAGLLEAPRGERARLRRARAACAGCAPATWCAWTRRAISISTIARRT